MTFRTGEVINFPKPTVFGGIDGGLIIMSVRGPVTVDDLSVANHPDPRTITVQAELVSTGVAYQGPLSLRISYQNKEVWHGTIDVNVPANQRTIVSKDITVKDAKLWGLDQPVLYQAGADIASIPHSGKTTSFGFRWFDIKGQGENPRLALNGHRVFVSSAISWGYWAPNGLFPDQAAVQREIDAVHLLGLNCIQTHRHFPKAAVLDGFDQAGLLRYCEPGGGYAIWDERFGGSRAHYQGPIDTSGINGEPTSFANRYELAKILAMVKAFRSHPSVILWSLNNETDADLHNPKIFHALRQVHELDPSRILLLKSSYGPSGEVLGLPYSTNLTYGDDASHHDSGWHDIHNEDDAGVYQDSLYKNPAEYKCFSNDTNGIAMWGELGTAASPDDDFATVNWYQQHQVPGYNRAAATARLNAYDAFLDKYQFRQAFPTTEDLFRAVGARHYFAAAHIIENARISDANDYIAITGWESTTVDNNSGLVNALRQLKADPALVHQANAPELIVVRPRHYVVAKGDTAVVDIYVVNETNLNGPLVLHFSAAMDADKTSPFFEASFPARLTGGETFGQLLKDNIQFTLPEAGAVTLTASLTVAGNPKPILQRTEPVLGVDPEPVQLTNSIACLDYDGKLLPALKRQLGVTAVSFDPAATKADTILVSSRGVPRSALNLNNTQHFAHAANTEDPGLFEEQSVSKSGDLAWYQDLAPGQATVELFFVETYFDNAGIRLFDVALNGKTVLRNFDLEKEAGGKGKAIVKKFTVDCPNGKLALSIPKVESDQPEIAAIRITDAQGKVIREVFRAKAYQSPTGEVWSPVNLGGFNWDKVLPNAMSQVRNGARLVLLGSDAEDINLAAKVLARENILTSSGTAGFDDTPWLGHWYFCRKHWLLDGLPSNCVFDWQYQAGGTGNGFILDAPGMEPVVAYGKNPGPGLGFNAVVVPVGQGQIVLLGLAGLDAAFIDDNPNGFQPVTARRIIYNALRLPPKL